MKSKHLLLTLLLALVVPWAANAQQTQTQTLTVYENATGTSNYVPVYGTWADAYLKCEFIVPATELTNMVGGTISKMEFAVSSVASEAWTGTFQVFMKEVTGTTLSAWSGTTDATIVYEGQLNGTTNPMIVTFSNNNTYTYEGGNLLIGFYQTEKGSFKGITFKGQSATGASGSNYNSGSLANVSFTQRNFIPTTTFTYVPAAQTDCEKPETVAASQITQNTAMLNWEGGSTPGNGYNGELKGGQYADWTRVFTHASQGVMLTGLVENTAYQARVQTVCSSPNDPEEEASNWKTTNFITPAYFSNFKAEIVPGQGTKATFSWTANGDPTEWQLCINGDETNLITMTENPFTYEGFTPETTYTAKMRAFVGDNTGAWSNIQTFTPTDSYLLTLNDGVDENTYVPVYGSYCDYGNRSQFIIPAADLTAMQWGTLSELTFYSSNEVTGGNYNNVPYFQNVVFKVYLTEVSKTTFESAEFFDWSNLNEVYNGSLVWSGKEWVFNIEDTYTYKGGNLLIGLHQTEWTSSYTTINWLGVNQPSGSNTAVSQYANSSHSWTANAIQFKAFLPKVTIKYIPGEEPDCLPVSGLTLGEIAATSAKLGWTASASGETHWKLQYRVSGTSEWSTVVVAENDLVQGFYPLQGLTDNTRYNWQVAAWCGYPEDEPISDYVSGDDFDTPCLPIAALPLETFEDYQGTTNSNINNLPDCWNYINTCTNSSYSGTPNIYSGSSYAYSGTKSLRFYSYSYYPAENYAILPMMENLDGMRIKFYARYYNNNTNLIVGTMTDPKDATTFEALENGTISDLTTTYKPYKLNLTGASGKYIALKIAGTSSYSVTVYVDNILVEAIPDCEENEGLAVVANSVGKRAASFRWTAPDGQNAWQIGFSLTNSTEDITYTADVDNPDGSEVTGLEPGTTYYAWVRGNCTASEHGYSVWSSGYVTFTTDVACPVPATPVVDAESIEEERAFMTWVAGGEETAWNIQLATYDASTETWSEYEMIKENHQSTSYTIEGLTQAHTYRVRVQAICGGEDGVSDWSNYAEFDTKASCFVPENFELTEGSETASGATVTWTGTSDHYQVEYREAVLIYEDDFESYTASTSTVPTDWTRVNGSPDVYGSYYHSGSKCLRFTGSYNNIIALPQFSTETNLLKISFFMRAENNSLAGDFEVGYITNVNDASTFVKVGQTYHYSDYTSYQSISDISMASAPAGARIAFRHIAGATNYWWFVDDVVVERIQGDPWNVADDNVTDLTYTFNQLDDNTTYEVRVKGVCTSGESQYSDAVTFTTLDGCPAPTNFTLGDVTEHEASFSWTQPTNGIAINEWIVKYRKSGETEWQTLTPNPEVASATLNNLDSGTLYEVLIAPACNEEKILEDSFQTVCEIVVVDVANPYNQDFEGSVACWTVGEPSNNYNWVNSTSYYHSASHGMVTGGFYGPLYLYTPEFNINTTASNAELSFWSMDQYIDYYTGGDNDAGGLNIVKITTDGTNWTQLWCPTIDELSETWKRISIDLTSYIGQDIIICFEYQGEDAHRWSVDDVRVAVVETFTKTVNGYGDNEGGYVLIASPLADNIDATEVTNLTTGEFDLYAFDQDGDAENNEWLNYELMTTGENPEHANFTELENGKGYLYANESNVTLTFTGVRYNGDGVVNLEYNANAVNFAGWNLIGNPFANDATIDQNNYYRLNQEGTEVELNEGNSVGMFEGIFVKATDVDQTVTFTEVVGGGAVIPGGGLVEGILNLNVIREGNRIDMARVRFGEGRGLEKFQLNPNHTKVYFEMNGKDMAVVYPEGQVGEMPVSFKAEHNGSYTLSFTSQEVSFSYLHLIDNMTGADVDLLANPSYSFSAQTTDYASRFRLVFATGSSIDGDSFAFINGMGNLCIFGIEGEATLQVVDVLGHVISSNQFSGSYEQKLNVAPGVYMLRLINGNDVKVQKMVIK